VGEKEKKDEEKCFEFQASLLFFSGLLCISVSLSSFFPFSSSIPAVAVLRFFFEDVLCFFSCL